jgi:uncharacterized protein
MSISLYQITVPVFTRFLNNLAAILDKATTDAEKRKFDPIVFLQARLYPDMFDLAKQVHRAADAAVGVSARLAGLEPPKFEAKRDSVGDLIAYIRQATAFLTELKPEQIDGQEARTLSIPRGDEVRTFQGQSYLLNNALPNFYFHLSTAYGILRHNGVEIGKQDFLGRS